MSLAWIVLSFILLVFAATSFRISRENDTLVQAAIGGTLGLALCAGTFFFLHSFAKVGLGVSIASVLAAPIGGWFFPEIVYLLGFKRSLR